MKKLINKIKKIDKTKRIVILFITISFVFIGGFSIYNGVTGNYQKDSIVVSTSKDKKKENTKKDKENKQSSEDELNQVTESNNDTQGENTTTQETEKKSSSYEKSNSSSSTTQSDTKSSGVNQSHSTPSQSQQSQANSNQSSSVSNNSTNSQQNNNINVSIQVIGMGNTMMSGTLNMDKGKTVYDALIKIASQNGISVEGTSIYIRGIGDLYEKQHGNLSGWMYSVNGVFPNKSCGYYKLENNDKIIWRYVNYN